MAPHVPITVDATVKAYQSALKAIQGRKEDGAAWMAQLHDAYRTHAANATSTNARINIVDVYLELVLLRQGRAFASEPSKRTFTDYTRAQFIYDFYEFTTRQRLAHKGRLSRCTAPPNRRPTARPKACGSSKATRPMMGTSSRTSSS